MIALECQINEKKLWYTFFGLNMNLDRLHIEASFRRNSIIRRICQVDTAIRTVLRRSYKRA